MAQVKRGDKVKIHYTGRLKDGTVFDSSVGGDPLAFTVGKGKVIKGLENAVIGMSPGETKTATISPALGYGPRRPELVITVNRDELPDGIIPAVGELLKIKEADGSHREFTVSALEGDRVTLDGNDPLAGKNLIFEIKLLSIG